MKLISYGTVVITLLFILVFSCTHIEKNQSHQNVPDANILKGKKLAELHCQSCHLLPDPSLLNSKAWENGVLPGMGPRLGIFNHNFQQYPSSRYDKDLDSGYYPSSPVVSFQDWQYIIDYYTAVSPDSLPEIKRAKAVSASTGLFNIEKPIATSGMPVTTCLVKIDTGFTPHQIMVGDMIRKRLYRFDAHLSLIDSLQAASPVVDLYRNGKNFLACNIGVMNPNNGKHGSAGTITIGDDGKMSADSVTLFDNLARPVQVTPADFNRDGKTDYLVCEFGNLTGALSWMENTDSGHFTRHVLRALPGSMKAYLEDVNHDGLTDIWALFSQAQEGIFLFTNKGNGVFSQEEVLRFQAINGSSYFEFADFNKDGHPDILYTCGDNADYSAVLKPYHGVYIYLNDGQNHFKQAYFFSMHGCFKAMARDFDGDGNLDIAAISFFADYAHHPEESFVYLANKGNLDFQPYTVPGTPAGRWLTMDAGDIDGDGKTDIVLGNFSISPATVPGTQQWKATPSFIVLKNTMKNNGERPSNRSN